MNTNNPNLSNIYFDAAEQLIIDAADKLISALPARRQMEVVNELKLRAQQAMREEKNARARARYKAKRDEEEKTAQPHRLMAKLSLDAGDIIRVKGTQDGHGMREVKYVEGSKVVCHQLYGDGRHLTAWQRHYHTMIGKTFKPHDHTGSTTRNDLKNVTHVMENGKLVKFQPFKPS